ncbi:MAG: signal peptidase I [Defluviitaleaceae bacterium]|nr:signal peptidase I [Defluviitaleaceae bacterium]
MVFVVLAFLAIAHAVSLMTGMHAMPYFHVLRPAVFMGLWLLMNLVGGRSTRPVYKGHHAVLMVGFGISLYITLFVLLGIIFGFAQNMMAPTLERGLDNLWIHAPVALCSEFLRHRLIRDPRVNKKTYMIALVTIVFIFTQVNNFSGMDVFFSETAPIIMLNVVLSYIAVDGKLAALLLLRGVFVIAPVVIPVFPGVPNDVWALFLHGILFTTLFLYRKFMPEDENKRRELREPFWKRHAWTAVLLVVLIIFNMGLFPIIPSVVLTDSMAGAIDRGSVALVRRAFDEINEGDIIQFENVRGLTVIHRVIEVRYDIFGEPYFITQGDANDRPDSDPVTQEQVIGVVFGSFRHVGMLRVWVDQILR